MENKKSIFSRFSKIFKSEPWYLPFPQVVQDFAVRFASEDKAEKDLFKQTQKLLMRKYKGLKSNKELADVFYKGDKKDKKNIVFDSEAFSKHLDAAIYEDDKILPNLITIGDEEFLSKLYFKINEMENSTELKISIISNPNCPVDVILDAISPKQPEALRRVGLLKNEVSYTEKVYALQDVLVGNSNLGLKNYFSQNLKPAVSDVPDLMELLADNALKNKILTSLWLQYDRYIINISGYICDLEASYATSDLVLENTVLFREEIQNGEIVKVGTFKNRDAATGFLKKKFGTIPFVAQDFVVPESQLPVEEEVETEAVSEESPDDKKKDSKKDKNSKK